MRWIFQNEFPQNAALYLLYKLSTCSDYSCRECRSFTIASFIRRMKLQHLSHPLTVILERTISITFSSISMILFIFIHSNILSHLLFSLCRPKMQLNCWWLWSRRSQTFSFELGCFLLVPKELYSLFWAHLFHFQAYDFFSRLLHEFS